MFDTRDAILKTIDTHLGHESLPLLESDFVMYCKSPKNRVANNITQRWSSRIQFLDAVTPPNSVINRSNDASLMYNLDFGVSVQAITVTYIVFAGMVDVLNQVYLNQFKNGLPLPPASSGNGVDIDMYRLRLPSQQYVGVHPLWSLKNCFVTKPIPTMNPQSTKFSRFTVSIFFPELIEP